MRSKSKNTSRASVETTKSKIKNIPLGSEFDLTIDMNEDFILTAVHALDLNAIDRKSYALATSRSKSSKLSTRGNLTPRTSRVSHLNLTDALLEGVAEPTVHRVGVVTSRTTTIPVSQPPVKLSRFDSRLSVPDASKIPKTARTIRPDFPNGYVHNFVFGFENPEPYIPHPFVSSHKPKSNRPKTASARRIQDQPEFKIKKKAKLSARREVPVKQNKLTNSIILDGFVNFMNEVNGSQNKSSNANEKK